MPTADEAALLQEHVRGGKPVADLATADRVMLGAGSRGVWFPQPQTALQLKLNPEVEPYGFKPVR